MVPNRRILEVVDIDGRRVTKARRRREKRKRRMNMGEPTPKLKLSLSRFRQKWRRRWFFGPGPITTAGTLGRSPPFSLVQRSIYINLGVRKAGTLNLKKALISIPVCNSKIFILPYEGNFPRNTPSVLLYHPVSLPLLHSPFFSLSLLLPS